MTPPNEIHITRLYDAPVKMVWDAWTDLEQVAKWWGPRGFTLTTHSKELKPGGIWNYTMHGPDGTDYPNKTLYHEVVKYKKLVYDHGGYDDRPPLFRVTVTFLDRGEQTEMHMVMALPTPDEAIRMQAFIKNANGYSTWDRLAEYLAKGDEGKDLFVINRSFDAPIEVMFEMWTDPKHVMQWSPPTGATMQFIRAEIRPGGTSFYRMDGQMGTMYGRVHYMTINKPDLIVYTQQFSDEKENVSRHPMAPTWPETMLTTVRFFKESDKRTRICLTWEPYGNVTAEEVAIFVQAKTGMTMGWTGSFDKLESKLADLNNVKAAS